MTTNPYKMVKRLNLLALTMRDDHMISIHSGENGIYIYVNNYCEQLLGYKPKELLGTSAYSLIHPDDKAMIRDSHKWVLRGEDVNFVNYRLLRKDKEWEDVDTIVWSFEDGVMAITESHQFKEIEATIAEMNEKMDDLMEVLTKI